MRLPILHAMSLMILLAACAARPPETSTAAATDTRVGLPGKIVRTDGEGSLQLVDSGAAHCNLISDDEIRRALTVTNNARARQGLTPLRRNPKAQAAAEAQACDMASRGAMTHAGRGTKGPAARIKAQGYKPTVTAENIAAGRFGFDQASAEWVASPKHLANIVIPGLRDFGTAYALGADGKTGFYAAVYAQPR